MTTICESKVVSLLEHVIRVTGVDVGLLSFERTTQGAPWHDGDVALARGLSSYLALTVGNHQQIELEKKAAKTARSQAAILENAITCR